MTTYKKLRRTCYVFTAMVSIIFTYYVVMESADYLGHLKINVVAAMVILAIETIFCFLSCFIALFHFLLKVLDFFGYEE